MKTMPLPAEGGCRCGRLRFRLDAAPMMTSACHCRGCQRMTGSAYSLTITVPDAGFALTAGEAVIGGVHGHEAIHHHCDRCKSWVYTTVVPSMGFVNVRATMLDDPSWFTPFMEAQTAEKLPFALTGAVRSFDRFPAMEDYPALIEAYRATG